MEDFGCGDKNLNRKSKRNTKNYIGDQRKDFEIYILGFEIP